MEPSVLETIRRNDVQGFIGLVRKNEAILDRREPSSMNTVLHVASKFGHADVASYIIASRPDMVSAENKNKDTPFHEACRSGNAAVLKLLLDADPASACKKVNSENRTALFVACASGHADAASLLLARPGVPRVGEDGPDRACIHAAAASGHKDVVAELVSAFPELVNAVDENGNFPLHCASGCGHGEIAERLLRIDPRPAERYNNQGLTPLHLAAINYKFAVLQAFIAQAVASFQCLTKDGDTVFHLAARHGHCEAVALLVRVCNGLSLFACRDRHGNTILHLAVSERQYGMAEYLINNTRLDINARNGRGLTALDVLDQARGGSETRGLEAVFHRAGGKRSTESSSLPLKPPQRTSSMPLLPLENVPRRILKESEMQFSSRPNRLEDESRIRILGDAISPSTPSSLSSPQSRKSSPRSPGDQDEIARDPESTIAPDSAKDLALINFLNNRKNKQQHKVYTEALQNARNTITLVAVLIATVTFAAGISPPGGVYQDRDGPRRGKSIASGTTAFKVFAISNELALFTSLSLVVVLVSIIPFKRKAQMRLLSASHKVMWAAVTFVAISYIAATWVVVPSGRGTETVIVALLVVSTGTLGSVFICLGKKLVDHLVTKNRWKKRRDAGDEDEQVGDLEMGSENSDVASSYHKGYHSY